MILINILYSNKNKNKPLKKVVEVWEWAQIMIINNKLNNKLLKNQENQNYNQKKIIILINNLNLFKEKMLKLKNQHYNKNTNK